MTLYLTLFVIWIHTKKIAKKLNKKEKNCWIKKCSDTGEQETPANVFAASSRRLNLSKHGVFSKICFLIWKEKKLVCSFQRSLTFYESLARRFPSWVSRVANNKNQIPGLIRKSGFCMRNEKSVRSFDTICLDVVGERTVDFHIIHTN